MRLRVIAGELGGRRFEAPTGRGTRPTAERVREAWFSAIGPRVAGAAVFDLYAGSGALGIEALSRGARHVHFVESDRRALGTLRRNLSALGLEERSSVVAGDALVFVRGLPRPVDLALADPPYGGAAARSLLEAFRERPFADELWLEHAASDDPGGTPRWSRRYGDTELSGYRASDAVQEAGSPPAEPDES